MLKKPLSILIALVMMLSLVSGLPVMAVGTDDTILIPQNVFVYYSAGDGEGGTVFSDMVEADTDLTVRTFDSLSTFKAPAGNHFAGWVGSDGVTITADEVAAGCSKTIPMVGTDLSRA